MTDAHRKRYYLTNCALVVLAAAIVVSYWWIGAATTHERQQACENQHAHIRNLNDWVKRLRATDERLVETIHNKRQRNLLQGRIHIFGEYLIREQRIDYGACP